MNRRPVTPAVRKRRIFTDALLLLAGLALLLLMLDVPIPYFTRQQALSATQTRYLYGPGAVLARVENDTSVDCILQDGSCYAVCTLPREGLFWGQGTLDAVVNDPSIPLVPLPRRGSLLVVVNDPNIAEVEVLYYAQYSGGFHTLRQAEPLADKCYLFYRPAGQSNYHFDDDGFLLRGYDRAGNLIYESEAPSHWAEWWGLTIPE